MSRGGPPTPPAKPLVEGDWRPRSIWEAPMSRDEATTLIGVGALAAGALLYTGYEAAENYYYPRIFDHTETEFRVVNGTGIKERPEGAPVINPFLVFDGLGRTESMTSAREAADFLFGTEAEWIPVKGILYSSKGVDFPKMRDWVEESAEGHTGVNMIGVSKGALEGLYTHASMDNPPHLDNVIVIGGPSDVEDVYEKELVKLIVDGNLPVNLATDFLAQAARAMEVELSGSEESSAEQKRYSRRDLFGLAGRVATKAARALPELAPPKLYKSGLEIVRRYDAAVLMQILRDKGAITKKTKFYYLKCKPQDDKVVMVDQADDKYQKGAADVKAQYQSIPYKGIHAQAFAAYGAMKEQFWKDQIERWKKQNTADSSAV